MGTRRSWPPLASRSSPSRLFSSLSAEHLSAARTNGGHEGRGPDCPGGGILPRRLSPSSRRRVAFLDEPNNRPMFGHVAAMGGFPQLLQHGTQASLAATATADAT